MPFAGVPVPVLERCLLGHPNLQYMYNPLSERAPLHLPARPARLPSCVPSITPGKPISPCSPPPAEPVMGTEEAAASAAAASSAAAAGKPGKACHPWFCCAWVSPVSPISRVRPCLRGWGRPSQDQTNLTWGPGPLALWPSDSKTPTTKAGHAMIHCLATVPSWSRSQSRPQS